MKLHIGCGNRKLPGFVNVDLVYSGATDIICDARALTMCGDESIDEIYASHVLEHFYPYEVPEVLAEWRRILSAEGILRLAVPDFDSLVSLYNSGEPLDAILGPLYGRQSKVRGPVAGLHKTVYTFSSLRTTLLDAGFGDVQRWRWREFFVDELAGFDDYSQSYIPHMQKDTGKLISLNVVATKL